MYEKRDEEGNKKEKRKMLTLENVELEVSGWTEMGP